MKHFLIAILVGVIFFSSCKKENSSGGRKGENKPPIANAGPDQIIFLPIIDISLDGSESNDPDGHIINWFWEQISGPSSSNVVRAGSVQTQVNNLLEGSYEFELKVTDGSGLIDKDTVLITVNSEPSSSANIYVAGMINNLPAYWKNGQSTILDNQAHGFTGTSIAVVGNDVYVAGTRNELVWSDYGARYWKNGQAVSLGDSAGATSITVAGNDVYVAGWKWEPSASGAIAVAKYWKNGQPIDLTDGTRQAYGNSIIVNGTDVYVAGQEAANSGPSGKYVAKYWKNGVAVSLTSGSSDAVANYITVANNDVYIAGYENGIAKYWKNGQSVSLSPGIATSIAVIGSDVHAVGYYLQDVGHDFDVQWKSVAKYWKNGQEITLNSDAEAFTSVAVHGNYVYIAGSENRVAKYWKNGHAIPLANGQLAKSIVVTD